MSKPDMIGGHPIPEHALHVATIRSPVSKGVIKSINIPHLPRDYRSFTAEDFPGSPDIQLFGVSIPILAPGRVSYRGQPIALIAGPDRQRVAEAVRLTRLVIEEEPAVFGFETWDSSRIAASSELQGGDVDGALGKAELVVERDFRLGAHYHYYPETHRAYAVFDYDKLKIHSSTQWPFQVRQAVARSLAVKDEEVVVLPVMTGPHLDGKLWYPSLIACQVALVAMLCGKPAVLILSRFEDFMYTTKRAPVLASYRVGMDNEGHLLAMDVRIAINVGAHSPLAEELAARSALLASGVYSCLNFRVSARSINTNLPPMDAYAGMGSSTTFFGMERMARDCAAALDMDPNEWRIMNLASRGDPGAGRFLKKNIPYDEVVQPLLRTSDYPRKRSAYELLRKRRADPGMPPGFGIGLAFGFQSSGGLSGGPGMETATIEAELSKSLTIRTSSVPGSIETIDIWKRLAADTIGIDPSLVQVESVGTDRVPDAGPSTMSRNIGIITKLVTGACEGIRTRRFREALPITVRKSYRPRLQKAEIVSPMDGATWAGAVVETGMDPISLRPQILGIWLSVKCGRLLSRSTARRALENGATTAVGLCMGEYLDLSDGSPKASAMATYRLPRLTDLPPVHIHFVEDDSSDSLGLGELACSLIPAAFANAIGQAIDAPWDSLPIRGPVGEPREEEVSGQ
ncbi:MAG: xanthine dehydrogenase family protein molybdopterin-binding subunit [Clostridia bacterium]|jgi:CO/xanthine dehydrogenase Mo-binding subunit